MFQSVINRVRYERTYSMSERWERGKEKTAIWLARRLPQRFIMWVIICRHADVTGGNRHPDEVTVRELTENMSFRGGKI